MSEIKCIIKVVLGKRDGNKEKYRVMNTEGRKTGKKYIKFFCKGRAIE